jgi:hypothetical protein
MARPVAFVIALTAGLVTTWPVQTGADGHSPVTSATGHVSHSPKVPQKPSPPPISDASSTNTPNWTCIRFHESTNGKLSSNLYQFQGSAFRSITGLAGSPGAYPRAVQDSAALALYAWWQHADGIGFHPWLADRYVCHLPW